MARDSDDAAATACCAAAAAVPGIARRGDSSTYRRVIVHRATGASLSLSLFLLVSPRSVSPQSHCKSRSKSPGGNARFDVTDGHNKVTLKSRYVRKLRTMITARCAQNREMANRRFKTHGPRSGRAGSSRTTGGERELSKRSRRYYAHTQDNACTHAGHTRAIDDGITRRKRGDLSRQRERARVQ